MLRFSRAKTKLKLPFKRVGRARIELAIWQSVNGKFWPAKDDGRSVGLFAAPAAVNAQNLVQKNHFPFFTAPLSFPKCPDNSAKTAAAPSSAVGKRGRPSGGEGRYFTWSIHLFSPIAGWVGIGWSVDGRSFGRAVSQFFLSKQPSALQSSSSCCLFSVCNSCGGTKLGSVWARKTVQDGTKIGTLGDGRPSSGRVSGQAFASKM